MFVASELQLHLKYDLIVFTVLKVRILLNLSLNPQISF